MTDLGVQRLVKSRDGISVKFKEFIGIDKAEKLPVLFEGGDDAKYFSIRIDQHLDHNSWSQIVCDGKKKVLDLRAIIRDHEVYKSKACLFFIDADFDENTDEKNFADTYITPCYSIENLYIQDEVFEKILNQEFGVRPHGDDNACYCDAVRAYTQRKQEFLTAISEFNYIYYDLKRRKKDHGESHDLSLNNTITATRLTTITLNSVTSNYNAGAPSTIFHRLDPAVTCDIPVIENQLCGANKEMFFRGKQQLEFFVEFLCILIRERSKKSAVREIFTERKRLTLRVDNGNVISALSQYATTPVCLIAFLTQEDLGSP